MAQPEYVFGGSGSDQPTIKIQSPDTTVRGININDSGIIQVENGGVAVNTNGLAFNNNTKTSSGTYDTICSFIYQGSDVIGAISAVKAIGRTSAAATAGIRIIDATNGDLVICEVTNVTNTTDAIIDLGTITNVPTGEVMLKLQAKTTSGSIWISYASVKY